ncbi:MFS transporter, partial [Streptomyces javensis]|nr:MFS transporter [Streptomyces javensis]
CGAALGVAGALTLIATQAVVRPERAGEASGVTKAVITTAAGLGVALSGDAAEAESGAAVDAALMAAGGCCLAGAALLVITVPTRIRPGGSDEGRSAADGRPD